MSQQPVHENTTGPGLVNETLLFRKQLRRLYQGTVREFLRELFQNSHRAGASNVEVTILAPGSFTYRDDGHGLLNGLHGLFDLLCIANSSYEDEAVEPNQTPMGMGFYSLIVHERVRRVRIESNTVALDIDTTRFLDSRAYRESWVARVEKRPAPAATGFSLLVEGDEDLTEQVRAQLQAQAPTPDQYWGVHGTPFGPALGYAGHLSITCDGRAVETELPAWFALSRAEIEDSYQGNVIRIALSDCDSAQGDPREFARNAWPAYCYQSSAADRWGLRTNWYGQPITDRGRLTGLRVFLDVRAGTSVTPQAPTRQSLMQDAGLADLYTWVNDRVFRYVCGAASPPRPEHIDLIYGLDEVRAKRECPWVLVRPRRGLPSQPATCGEQAIASYEDVEALTIGRDRVVRKTELDRLLVMADEVVVLLPGTHAAFRDARGELPDGATADPRPCTFAYGLASFLAPLGLAAYQPHRGADRAAVLWWRPGELAHALYTTDLGTWGIGTQGEPPAAWQPVPAGSMFYVHDEIESWSIDNVCFCVGVASTQDFIAWLQHYARGLWYEDEEGEGSEEAFDESVDDLIRSVIGNTIAAHLVRGLIQAVRPFFAGAAPGLRISMVEVLYGDGATPRGIRVHSGNGDAKELDLY